MFASWIAAGALATGAAGGVEQQAAQTNATIEISSSEYRGQAALKAVDRPGAGGDPLVMLPVTGFGDGVIEAEVAGLPAPGAPADVRGFVGIAFRVQADPRTYEAFYIRPTNGRADEQLRRNHATQYISMPDFTWNRLRREQPGVYESYADMTAGEWTKLRIEVDGHRARLFVGGAEQPSLIVNDLKLGPQARGGVALWVGTGSESYFRNVKVTKANDRHIAADAIELR